MKNISLKISTGEIYGILGIEGNGQKELEEIVSGQNKNFEGEILVNNVPLIFKDGFNLKDSGIGYIPSHREEIGIIEKFSLEQNLMLGHQHNKAFRENLFFDKTGIKTFTEHVINSYDISPADPEAPLSTFSGGNQQKVVLGREELENLIVLFACNPTRGIDIKAIHYLNEKLFALRKEGAAIFMIISDIEEALHTCDRIAVIYSGKIIKEFHPEETNAQELGYYMLGGKNKQN